jgi:hypothetical protein
VLALLAGAAAAQTSVYRWVDKERQGPLHDQPPPPDARQQTQKSMGGGYVDTDSPVCATQAMKRNP